MVLKFISTPDVILHYYRGFESHLYLVDIAYTFNNHNTTFYEINHMEKIYKQDEGG